MFFKISECVFDFLKSDTHDVISKKVFIKHQL